MPIVRVAGQLVYFAHVPKCAGTAVRIWLEEAFGPLAFHDTKHLSLPNAERWTMTSPQHVDRKALSRLFPEGFFDVSVAVVRHPVSRLISAFRFQRDIEETLPANTEFSNWLAELDTQKRWQHDNHLRPMDDIVPLDADVFALEGGLEDLRTRVQGLAGPQSPTLPEISKRNVLTKRLENKGCSSSPVTPTDDDIARIADLYAVDFERFDYDLETWRMLR